MPADQNVPIVELKSGQKVVLTAVARLGTAKEHAKFQPVCVSGYKNLPVISISDKCDLCKACIDACPRGVFKVEKGKLVAGEIYKCSMCKLCSDACDAGAISCGRRGQDVHLHRGDGRLVQRSRHGPQRGKIH